MHLLNYARFLSRGYSSKAATLRKSYDVVVSGGGLVGTCAACAIASDPLLRRLRVLVIEPREPKIWTVAPPRFSNRVYSVSPGTRRLFEELSAWSTVEALRYRPVRRLQIWEASSDAAISFQQPGSDGNVSYVVEDEVLAAALWTRLRQLTEHVDILHGVSAKSYTLPSRRSHLNRKELDQTEVPEEKMDKVKILLSDGTQIETSLLIGADGPSSSVRTAMGVNFLSWSYEQKGIVATLQLSEPQVNDVGWQRFTSVGPIALLPLDEKRSSLVWSTNTENANKLMALSDEEFLDSLNLVLWENSADKNEIAAAALRFLDRALGKFGQRTGSFAQLPPTLTGVDSGSRAVFPLGLGHAVQYVIPHVALIGDAAHRIHPLAGLGVNLGFSDVAALRDTLRKATLCGAEIGSWPHLLQYETKTQRTDVPVMAAVDSLHRLYSTQWTPAVALRSVGLNLVNSCEPLKNLIIKKASL